jgi:hypothetical protein
MKALNSGGSPETRRKVFGTPLVRSGIRLNPLAMITKILSVSYKKEEKEFGIVTKFFSTKLLSSKFLNPTVHNSLGEEFWHQGNSCIFEQRKRSKKLRIYVTNRVS